MIEFNIPDEWNNRSSRLAEIPCNITGNCHFRGSSKADENSLVHEQTTSRSLKHGGNSTLSTMTNTIIVTTSQVKFTYEINVPYNTSILQQMPRLNEEFEIFLNQSLVEAAIQVMYMASLLGASTTRCTPKDGLHICAVASANLILAQNGNTTTTFQKVDLDAKSGESIDVSFPISSQQVQFIILNRLFFYMQHRKDDTAEVSLITPVPTSTNLILQFTSNGNKTITTMSQQDIEWLEMCATSFIQQYITNSGITSSIIPPTTFTLVSNQTECPGDWRQDFPAIGSEVEGKNVTSSKKLYVNLFVAGQYNALLQSNSDFDLAVKKLFQDKNDLLLKTLRWSKMNHDNGLNATKTTPSLFYDIQSIFLINPAPEVKAAISIYEKPHLSTSTELVWFSFSVFCAVSVLILLFGLNIKVRAVNNIRKKIRVDSEKKVEDNNYPSEKYDEPISMNHDLEQTISEEEKRPLSPKQEAESPENNRWSFSETIRTNSSSKTPRSPNPSKDETVTNPSLFSRQSSSMGSSNIRKRLSMSGLDSLQLLPVMKMDFSPNGFDSDT
jgi:hypothetical protein